MVLLRSNNRQARGNTVGPRSRNDDRPSPKLVDPRLLDHAVGLELQLVDLVEQSTRARVQGALNDAADLDQEVDRLQAELAETAARVPTFAD